MINNSRTPLVWEDQELGALRLHVNTRARRLVFRAKDDGIHVTLPPGITSSDLRKAIEELRPRLREAYHKRHTTLIDLHYQIDADFIHLSVVQGECNRFLLRADGADIQIVCPRDTDFSNEELQDWLRKVVGEAMRSRAKSVLPVRLQELAKKTGLTYRSVKINSSTTRWGSCSTRKDINLSYYLMLLPATSPPHAKNLPHYTALARKRPKCSGFNSPPPSRNTSPPTRSDSRYLSMPDHAHSGIKSTLKTIFCGLMTVLGLMHHLLKFSEFR